MAFLLALAGCESENIKAMSQEPEWGPNPERYARMAEPYPTPAEAEDALRRFMDGVAKLREECRIPEALIIVAAYYAPQERKRK